MPKKHYAREPQVAVCVVSGKRIRFSLNGIYRVNGEEVTGSHEVVLANGFLHWHGKPWLELVFEPDGNGVSFSLEDVTIGVNFHWERKETQTFLGTLRLLANDGKVLAINDLPVETYLESVISSEMSATSNMPLLMAHAVISRSWLLAQMENSRKNSQPDCGVKDSPKGRNGLVTKADSGNDDGVMIRWYDHTDHDLFDVCADDHCQRYQGITKETSPNVVEAIRLTRGQILTYEGEICDARFYKCCGGAMEEFQYCWDDTPKPYLKGIGDTPDGNIPDLTVEENAVKWILFDPESFCNTADKEVLRQVLNDYDQETTDFYRWHVDYSRQELSELVCRKSGIDFGQITDLVPMKRGTSGRIYELKIVGTNRTMTIGKELEIRRILSESHLYSSAFVVEKREDGFRLIGAGWGHGVGLCQIGAAVMGAEGIAYDKILEHYYPNSILELAW